MSETVKYRGYVIEITQDIDCHNPREWDNFGTLALKDSGWADEDISDQDEFYKSLLDDEEWALWCSEYQEYDYYSVDYDKARRNVEAKYIVLPVYKYEHSGVCYNTSGFSCPWDSGQNGFIYVSKEDVREGYGVKRISKQLRKRIETYLEGEVNTFSQAVSGEVYYYSIDDEDGDLLDGCGGYYGYDHEENGLLESAKNAIDYHIDKIIKYNAGRVKSMIRNNVPLQYREENLVKLPA